MPHGAHGRRLGRCVRLLVSGLGRVEVRHGYRTGRRWWDFAEVQLSRTTTMLDPNTAAAAGFQNPEAYEKAMGGWSRRLAPLLIKFGGLSDGDRVLDVGCGTGSLTFTVPEIANVSSVAGIDLTEPYLEFARAQNFDPRITFRTADARALPFEDNSFDRAFSMLVL